MRAPRTDRNGLEVLSRAACLELLGSRSLGRISVSNRGLPSILPVNYVLDGDDVVFRTGAGMKLYAAARRALVAFEVDEFDAQARSGWSVVVTGVAQEVTDVEERDRLASLPLDPWVPRIDSTHVIRLANGRVSGRRLARMSSHKP